MRFEYRELREARQAAQAAEQAWKLHKRDCVTCVRAFRNRKPDECCRAGWVLYKDRNAARVALDAERQRSLEPAQGQEALFGEQDTP